MTTMTDTEEAALKTITRSVADALDRYADAQVPWQSRRIEQFEAEAVHAFDSLLAIEPEAAVRETYAWDQGRLRSLSVQEIRTLANDYRALAASPPEPQGQAGLKQIQGVVGLITLSHEDWQILRALVIDSGADIALWPDRLVLREGLRIRAERQATGAEARIVKKIERE